MLFTVTERWDAGSNFRLNQEQTKDQVLAYIRNMNYTGGPGNNPTHGLFLAKEGVFDSNHGGRSDIPNVVVLLTDYMPSTEILQLMAEAKETKDLGISIICIGVSNVVCRPFTLG